MVYPDRAVPNWVNKWLMITSAFFLYDGSFCILRPHSLPGGCLEHVYYGCNLYAQADKHYADPTDSFVFTQGLGNLIEGSVCLLILLNVFKSVRLSKMVTILVSVMTAYKTTLFCIYSLDIGQGGRAFQGFLAELIVFGSASVWIVVPAYVTLVLLQDFVDTKPKGTPSRYSPTKADDSIDGTGSRRYDLRSREN